jgi:hypothetical protein
LSDETIIPSDLTNDHLSRSRSYIRVRAKHQRQSVSLSSRRRSSLSKFDAASKVTTLTLQDRFKIGLAGTNAKRGIEYRHILSVKGYRHA